MRIPVSKNDLEKGNFTKISRHLQKIWPLGNLGLMQAQNVLAGLLGYKSLHDAQLNAVSEIAPSVISRSSIINEVTWKLFRTHQINLSDGAKLASKLHLGNLDVDALTIEAMLERSRNENGNKDKFFIYDEFGYYAEPNWNPKTPMLLDAKLPAYSFAVLSDRKVFHWSLVEDVLNRLPVGYRDDLRAEEKYKNISDDALEMEFVGSELLPSVCETLLETIVKRKCLPDGYSIEWIFSSQGECLGRVLASKVIGGIIPVVYGIDDDEIYCDVAKLMCGETLNPVLPLKANGAPVYVQKFGFGGFDLAADLRTTFAGHSAPKNLRAEIDLLKQLPDDIGMLVVDGALTLTGQTFIERGQLFIRNQQWLLAYEIPSSILSEQDCAHLNNKSSLLDLINSTNLIPDTASAIYQLATEKSKSLFNAASRRLQSEAGISSLSDLFLYITTPESFDAYCDALIDEDLPIRYNDDIEDREDLIEDRTREMQYLEENGLRIKEVIPSLRSLKNTTLGALNLYVHGESPGSRHSGSVYPPEAGKLDEVVHLLTGMIVYAACCETDKKHPGIGDLNIVPFVIDRVISEKTSIENIPDEVNEIIQFSNRLESTQKFINGINQWRQKDDAMRSIRATGQYLYVGDAISREKPKSLADLMAGARSKGFTSVQKVIESGPEYVVNNGVTIYSKAPSQN
ncbi:MAG: hypothetical protein Q7K13_05890 [Polynucleobacter sp.]|uniref:hypothetical protein n=1 Tax=Polynucleobacter sp. TaxID=2029855 RepID=UPI0027163C68|nr:hypothetical protein [Polynucleobacter sp.]MDO8713993.1 hypothetical protein [Polynucleobacter sp.]